MGTKLTLTQLTSLANETTAITQINNNSDAIEAIIDLLVSRDGTAPNTWIAPQDINSQRLLNLVDASTAQEPITKSQLDSASSLNSSNANITNYTLARSGAVERTVQTRLEEKVSPKDFGAVGDGITDDTVAVQAAIDSLGAGEALVFPDGTYILTEGLTTTVAIHLIGTGAVKLDFTLASSTTDLITFTWSGGKPDFNAIRNITIDANDTGQDVVVMKGINTQVEGLKILNAGRDGLTYQTSSSFSHFIENFRINRLEIDRAGRNGLSFVLAEKTSGSFINIGLITAFEIREAGINGTGTEIKFIVPEDTTAGNKMANITFLSGNIDQRSVTRTEPYVIMVDRGSGVTNGGIIEQINWENVTVENTSGTIGGSAIFHLDPNIDNASSWSIRKVNASGGLAATFSGTSLKSMWYRNFSGQMFFGDSDILLAADASGDNWIVTDSGNNANVGISVTAPTDKLASIFLGDTDAPAVGGLTYRNTTDTLDVKAAGAARLQLGAVGATIPTGDLFITTPTTPASASSTGTVGTIAWDSSFIYVCVATDTWKRVSIATW